MKHTFRILCAVWLTMLCLFSISMPVGAADTVRPTVELQIINPPDAHYYLDILIDADYLADVSDIEHDYYVRENALDRSGLVKGSDPALADILAAYNENGWTARLHGLDGGAAAVIEANSTHRYLLTDSAPKHFKVILVTADGQTIISEPVTVKHFAAEVVFDAKNNVISEKTITKALGTHLGKTSLLMLCTFGCTLVIEGLILLLFFRRHMNKRNICIFVLTNFLTELFLYTMMLLLPEGNRGFFIAMPCIAALEIVLMCSLCDTKLKKKLGVLVTCSNLLRFAAGFFPFVNFICEKATSLYR